MCSLWLSFLTAARSLIPSPLKSPAIGRLKTFQPPPIVWPGPNWLPPLPFQTVSVPVSLCTAPMSVLPSWLTSPSDISVSSYGFQPGPSSMALAKLFEPWPFQMCSLWLSFLIAARSLIPSPLKSPAIGRVKAVQPS